MWNQIACCCCYWLCFLCVPPAASFPPPCLHLTKKKGKKIEHISPIPIGLEIRSHDCRNKPKISTSCDVTKRTRIIISGVWSTEKRFQKYCFVITSVCRFKSRHTIWNSYLLFLPKEIFVTVDVIYSCSLTDITVNRMLSLNGNTRPMPLSPRYCCSLNFEKTKRFLTHSIHCFPGARATSWEIENQRCRSNWHCQRPGCIKWLQTSRRSSHVSYTLKHAYTIFFLSEFNRWTFLVLFCFMRWNRFVDLNRYSSSVTLDEK